jgi:hypothetical protein
MATDTTLQSKTLKELRVLAKTRGVEGYSKLTKEQLVRLLARPVSKPVATGGHAKKARARRSTGTAPSSTKTKDPSVSVAAEAKSAPTPAAGDAPTPVPPAAVQFTATEEWVERAKYASRPDDRAATESFADLGEDIDRLPALSGPLVCLLPQKPGVLHAYWVLSPGEPTEDVAYKLRLCRTEGEAVNVYEEVAAQGRLGSWYFHVPETGDNAGMQVQLGYYRDGRFVTAAGRSVAHLPRLHASTRPDERWWVSESEFMKMYLLAGGGVAPGERYGYIASISSFGGASRSPK